MFRRIPVWSGSPVQKKSGNYAPAFAFASTPALTGSPTSATVLKPAMPETPVKTI